MHKTQMPMQIQTKTIGTTMTAIRPPACSYQKPSKMFRGLPIIISRIAPPQTALEKLHMSGFGNADTKANASASVSTDDR
jgi:hypothetical protein